MVITDFLERNARLYGSDIALVEVNPSEERDSAVTWREASLIAEAQPDAPYRRELSWRDFDRRANRFANFLLSRNVRRSTKVGILLMNCLEWLPIYFGILKAGCIAVPLNFRYASDEISYCLDLADVEVLVFGPEFTSRLDSIQESLTRVKLRLFVGRCQTTLRTAADSWASAHQASRLSRWTKTTMQQSIFPPARPAFQKQSCTGTRHLSVPA